MKNFFRVHKTDVMLCGIVIALLINALYCFSFSDSRVALVFAVFATGFVSIVYLVARVLESRGGLKAETIFLLGVIGCGIFYSIVFVPGSVPDESYHFQASYKLADQLLFLGPTTDSLPMRIEDARLLEGMNESQMISYQKYQMIANQFSLLAEQSKYISVVPRSSFDWGSNPPYVKLPSALGIVLASLLNLGSYPLFYLGRFFNLLAFAFLAYLAVRIIPVGKNAMMVVGLLPMTLHVVSSYSYDAGMIGLSFLLTALCFRAIYSKGVMSRRDKVALIVVAALLAPCKVVYAAIALLVLLIPRERFSSSRSSGRFKVLVLACSLAMIVVMRAATLIQMTGLGLEVSSGLDVRGEERGEFYSVAGMIADPLNTLLLYLRTFDSMGPFYLDTLVGGSLGWFQAEIHAPLFITLPLFLLLFLSAQRSGEDNHAIPGVHRWLFAGLAAAGWLAVMTSMVVGWTFTSENVIQGVQGRYFLPLLPMALMAFRSRHFRIDVPIGLLLLYVLIAINAAYFARTFAIAVGV